MFKSILLPVDLTEENEAAVSTALGLLGDSGGKATVLHVIETIADVEFEDMEDFYQRFEEKARTGMRSLAAPLEAAGLEVDQQVIYGKRAPEIVAFAQEHEADLIVMSSRPLDPDNPAAVWGSISHQVPAFDPQVALIAGCHKTGSVIGTGRGAC